MEPMGLSDVIFHTVSWNDDLYCQSFGHQGSKHHHPPPLPWYVQATLQSGSAGSAMLSEQWLLDQIYMM